MACARSAGGRTSTLSGESSSSDASWSRFVQRESSDTCVTVGAVPPKSSAAFVQAKSSRAWQRKHKCSTTPQPDVEFPAHPLGEFASDVEPQPRTARRSSQVRIAAIELLEDPLLILG